MKTNPKSMQAQKKEKKHPKYKESYQQNGLNGNNGVGSKLDHSVSVGKTQLKIIKQATSISCLSRKVNAKQQKWKERE